MITINLDAPIRCRHGRALVGGFPGGVEVQHDGTGSWHGDSHACDDTQAKAAKVAQAAALYRRERAYAAGCRSTRITPMGLGQRNTNYHSQNGARSYGARPTLTARQARRLEKKARRAGL